MRRLEWAGGLESGLAIGHSVQPIPRRQIISIMKISKTFGNYEISALVSFEGQEGLEAVGLELALLGALYLFERSVSSNAESQVFGNLLGWEKNAKGRFKRPAGFNRSSVEYSPSVAESLKFEFADSVALPSGKSVRFHGISVTENLGSSVEASKELLAFVKEFDALSLEKKIAASEKLKIDDHKDRQEVLNKCAAHIARVKAEAKAKLKGFLA